MTIQELYQAMDGDYEAALKILRMDKMIERFIGKFPNDKACQNMLAAWENKDEAGVFEGSHALKGVTANLGLLKLSAAASEISEEFRPGSPRNFSDEEVGEKMEAIKVLYDKTVAAIQSFSAG